MTDTTRLSLPLMDAAQAQKHVTHNDALVRLDALIHLSVLTRANAPSAPIAEGARYLVSRTPSGDFSGHSDQIACFQDGVWIFLAPRTGWRVLQEDAFSLLVYDGSSWRDIVAAKPLVDQFSRIGVGTPSDAGNPLSAKLNNALFAALPVSASGNGDLRFKLNKEASGNTVSQLYQSNWSGRAETGLMGDDAFKIKVSADGAAWLTAVNIDSATGNVGIGAVAPLARLDVSGAIAVNGRIAVNGPAFSATTVVGTNQTLTPGVYTKVQFKNEEFDTGDAFDNVNNFSFKPQVAGYYQVSANVRSGSPNIGDWQVVIYKNGAAFKSGSEICLTAGANFQAHVSALVYLNGSTDYVEIYSYSDAPNVVKGTQTGSYFQAVMVRGA